MVFGRFLGGFGILLGGVWEGGEIWKCIWLIFAPLVLYLAFSCLFLWMFSVFFFAQEASEASPAWLVVPSVLWVSLGFPCFSRLSLSMPSSFLFCFSACSLHLFSNGFLGVLSPSLCFALLSLAFPGFLLFYLVLNHLGQDRASRSLAKTGSS